MKITEFTVDELDLFRNKCSFTDEERTCFEMKIKDASDIELAFALNCSESKVAFVKRKMRAKIDEVLRQNVRKANYLQQFPTCGNCQQRVLHTMAEWARLPDFLSIKGQEYVYTDYRTEGKINYPRSKMGDGVTYVSELPFYTSCITEEDMERWDNKPDTTSNDFGKVIIIDSSYTKDNKFVFPTDGYVTLTFDREREGEFAEVEIYGASEKSSFKLKKYTDIDRQSKEVFVRKGMKCVYLRTSDNAEIKFIPLI